jgi:thiol-disulfide isomerase/thioredoxin
LTAVNVTEGERVTFTVLSGAEDVTPYATIHNVTDGTDLEGNVFAPADAGEWTFVAAVDGTESEPVTITAIVIADEGKEFYRRSLVLDFTGTWCVNCPRMQAAIEESMAARPGRIVPVAVHCKADAMRVKPLCDNLAKQFNVSAYPSAVVDMDLESLITDGSSDLLLSHVDRLLLARGLAAGLRVESVTEGESTTVTVTAKLVRDGDYTLSVITLEDGIVAAQTGGTEDYVHNNVLRDWKDSDVFTGGKEGDEITFTCTGSFPAKGRIVALVCRGGIVDNVVTCAAGSSVDYQYEENNE